LNVGDDGLASSNRLWVSHFTCVIIQIAWS